MIVEHYNNQRSLYSRSRAEHREKNAPNNIVLGFCYQNTIVDSKSAVSFFLIEGTMVETIRWRLCI